MIQIDWDTWSKIATTLSAIFAAISMISIFVVYRLGRIDDKLRIIRESIARSKTIASTLDSLVSIEMFSEITESIVSSERLSYSLSDIVNNFFTDRENRKKDELEKYLDEEMPAIIASMHTPIVSNFMKGLDELEIEAGKIEFDFPGLSRVVFASKSILHNSLKAEKKLLLDDDAWKAAILQLYEEDRNGVNVSYLKIRLVNLFVGTTLSLLKDNWQDNINDTLKYLDIVTNRYLEKNRRQLLKASHLERKVKIFSKSETSKVTDDLLEAEKCFNSTLPKNDLLELRQLSTQISAR